MTISVDAPITLEELVGNMASECDAFRKYAIMNDHSKLAAHLNFVKDGRILSFSDIVDDKDHLKVFLPVVGG